MFLFFIPRDLSRIYTDRNASTIYPFVLRRCLSHDINYLANEHGTKFFAFYSVSQGLLSSVVKNGYSITVYYYNTQYNSTITRAGKTNWRTDIDIFAYNYGFFFFYLIIIFYLN